MIFAFFGKKCALFLGHFFAKIENRDFWPPDLPVEILAKNFLGSLDEKKNFVLVKYRLE